MVFFVTFSTIVEGRNLAEELRDYQPRSQHHWAPLTFLSSAGFDQVLERRCFQQAHFVRSPSGGKSPWLYMIEVSELLHV
ncbi:hypothetical protein R1flu_008280 [Riccia fluitans]|uniref:Uncharacterized protein n=1 Tax=Riccia fluitans TaxID=41844 RepID=A0ABD1YBW6_9MARC